MAVTIRIELSVTVNTEEQALLIYEAAQNGLAETAIKDRVLFGAVAPTAVNETTFASPATERESTVQLTRVETRTTELKASKISESKERPRGLMGRKRMERAGG